MELGLYPCKFMPRLRVTESNFYRVGTSFAIIPVAEGAFAQMYENKMVGKLMADIKSTGEIDCNC